MNPSVDVSANTMQADDDSRIEALTEFEQVACDLCGEAETRPFRITRDHLQGGTRPLSFVQCKQCGLIYLNPRPTRTQIGAYYPDLAYHAFESAHGWKDALQTRVRRREAQQLLSGQQHPRVLEIGCGTGEFLAMLQQLGATTYGLEPNAKAAQVAREQSQSTIVTGTLDDVLPDALPQGLDLVIMRYALEHVHSPRETLRRIAALLKPGGRVALWVPNADSWDATLFGSFWRGLDAPRHLYLFTPKTLKRLSETAGLAVRGLTFNAAPNDWAAHIR